GRVGGVVVVVKSLAALACLPADTWAPSGERFKPAPREWDRVAVDMATLLRREMPHESRTALYRRADGASVLFGNDDFAKDARVRQDVAVLRHCLQEAGIPELGFGVSDDGHGWVVMVDSQDERTLGQVLFGAW